MELILKNKGNCLIWCLVFILVTYAVGSLAITQYHYFIDKKLPKKY